MCSACLWESSLADPYTADALTTGKSSCSSFASSSINKSNSSSTTASGLADGLSILLTTTTGFKSCSNAIFSTKRVCGLVPSY